jgi:hypothetical protein
MSKDRVNHGQDNMSEQGDLSTLIHIKKKNFRSQKLLYANQYVRKFHKCL